MSQKVIESIDRILVGKQIALLDDYYYFPLKPKIDVGSVGTITGISIASENQSFNFKNLMIEAKFKNEKSEEMEVPIPFKYDRLYTISNFNMHQVHPYNYTPEEFFKHGSSSDNKFFGIEIEMEGGGENAINASIILEEDNREEFAYIMHDGSLCEGFELVTHPSTLDYLTKSSSLRNMLEVANALNYDGDTQNCGLHIHIDRKAFENPSTRKNKYNIGKLIYLFEKHWAYLVALTRRDEDRLRRYAHRYEYKYNQINGDSFDSLLEMNEELLTQYSYDDKYFSINLKHSPSVEIRIFKGTSNYNEVIALVQLCDRLVDVCVDTKLDDIRKLSFYDIIAPLCDKVEFKEYLQRVIKEGFYNFDEELKENFEALVK